MQKRAFKKLVLDYYRAHGRHNLPWRKTRSPYRILISEVMLQQTQVDRVVPKYRSFLKKFPSFDALAKAPLRDVLAEWKGLGYNRRALALKRTAEIVVEKHGGKLPRTTEELKNLPGIGAYTAGAVRAFAWNKPDVFLETNIRTVFIYNFFTQKNTRQSEKISDKELIPLVEKTLDTQEPREWYYALMDYGSHLKAAHGNASQRSKTYTRQSRFAGSHRQLRAQILHEIVTNDGLKKAFILKRFSKDRAQTARALDELVQEGFIIVEKQDVRAAS